MSGGAGKDRAVLTLNHHADSDRYFVTAGIVRLDGNGFFGIRVIEVDVVRAAEPRASLAVLQCIYKDVAGTLLVVDDGVLGTVKSIDTIVGSNPHHAVAVAYDVAYHIAGNALSATQQYRSLSLCVLSCQHSKAYKYMLAEQY